MQPGVLRSVVARGDYGDRCRAGGLSEPDAPEGGLQPDCVLASAPRQAGMEVPEGVAGRGDALRGDGRELPRHAPCGGAGMGQRRDSVTELALPRLPAGARCTRGQIIVEILSSVDLSSRDVYT